MKMKYYGLSEQRIKGVIRRPKRIEEGIVENTIAVMKPAGSRKNPTEIWVMYQLKKKKSEIGGKKIENKKIKIISAWRYPGTSPKNNPIPEEILEEIKNII